jgi:hypothetical protein
MNSSIMVCSRNGVDVLDGLEMIPDYHSTELTQVFKNLVAREAGERTLIRGGLGSSISPTFY